MKRRNNVADLTSNRARTAEGPVDTGLKLLCANEPPTIRGS
jgi:hypothetical protein